MAGIVGIAGDRLPATGKSGGLARISTMPWLSATVPIVARVA